MPHTSSSPIGGLVKVTASSICEVLILSFVGYILARRGIIDKKTQAKINKLNVSFFTPALLFSKVAFTLNPARLAELLIVPIGFAIVTLVSTLAAWLMSIMFRLSKAQRNFAIACAMSPNSNSLPVALMQSLVVTVPQLHWDEEGEPEDTVDGMLGRALTYLVLYSTLGMFLRWSIGAKLLATVEEEGEEENISARESEPSETARLIDYDDSDANANANDNSANGQLRVNVRRPTGEGGTETLQEPVSKRDRQVRRNPRAWTHSFPNSPITPTRSLVDLDAGGLDEEEQERPEDPEWGDDGLTGDAARQRRGLDAGTEPSRNAAQSAWRRTRTRTSRVCGRFAGKPLRAVAAFMTAPLYAAILSLVVALIRPLQVFIDSLEPVVGALETAGACSIPLTMVVLGAYFHDEKPSAPPAIGRAPKPAVGPSPLSEQPSDDAWASGAQSGNNNSNGNGAESPSAVATYRKRKSFPWTKNPWNSSGSSAGGARESDMESNAGSESAPYQSSVLGSSGTLTDEPSNAWESASSFASGGAGIEEDAGDLAARNADRNSRGAVGRRAGRDAAKSEKEKKMASAERRTIFVTVASRMIVTPLILLPIVAWYAIATRYNVMDDPVFITCACLLIGSPPALTLAQITSQAAGGGSSFERLISRTIFVSYAILAAPTTIALVLTALLIAENDH